MTDSPSSFERDVKPLFRERNRVEMEWIFDLWSYDDVKVDAPSILQRLEDGTMPCDATWGDQQLDVFRSWMAGGYLR